MPTVVQFRRGTTAQNDAFTGAIGELSYDITTKEIRTHDGSTQGGKILATKDYVNSTAFSGAWDDITGKPVFADVATSGDYNDLTNAIDLSQIVSSIIPDAAGTLSLGSASSFFNKIYLSDNGIDLNGASVVKSSDQSNNTTVTLSDSSAASFTTFVDGTLSASDVSVTTSTINGNNALLDGVFTISASGNNLSLVGSLSDFSVTPGAGADGKLGNVANPWKETYSKEFHIADNSQGSYLSAFNINSTDSSSTITLAASNGFSINIASDSIQLDGNVYFQNAIKLAESQSPSTDAPNATNGTILYDASTGHIVGFTNGVWAPLDNDPAPQNNYSNATKAVTTLNVLAGDYILNSDSTELSVDIASTQASYSKLKVNVSIGGLTANADGLQIVRLIGVSETVVADFLVNDGSASFTIVDDHGQAAGTQIKYMVRNSSSSATINIDYRFNIQYSIEELV